MRTRTDGHGDLREEHRMGSYIYMHMHIQLTLFMYMEAIVQRPQPYFSLLASPKLAACLAFTYSMTTGICIDLFDRCLCEEILRMKWQTKKSDELRHLTKY